MIGLLGDSLAMETNRRRYVVSLSSGVSSAIAADRAINRYGLDNVELVFMDTLWEDDDNYRFLNDLEQRWHKPIIRLTEGRTPLQLFEDQHVIPNHRVAPCTNTLKIKMFLDYLESVRSTADRIMIVLGMNWTEPHRMESPRKNYGARGFDVEYPLMWQPYELRAHETVKSWGIEIPRMYHQGYGHANCGGRCVKQGQDDWLRTLTHYPDRFHEVAEWESKMRENPVNADYALARDRSGGESKPLTLYELKARHEAKTEGQLSLFCGVLDETSSCFCNAGDPGDVEGAA